MAKKKKEPVKTCSDCIHESACRIWTDGRPIADESASRCQNHETVKESGAYLCGVLDERKRKRTNADRIRAMSDEELCKFLGECKFCDICEEGCDSCTYNGDCDKRLLEWLQQPLEV